ncbi:MAG TPA: hemerythrin domain-containing protein [Methanomassiliicoccales archaeon]|jgi:hemerythrin-like domain-containing protein
MKASITLLSYDHGILRQVLDVYKDIVEKKSIDKHRQIATEGIEFLLMFMDHFHHGKEERFLFPAAMCADPEHTEDLQQLFEDHRIARLLAQGMLTFVRPGGDDAAFYENAGKLVEHMAAHIQKEEDVIFPGIESKMDDKEDMKVYKQFEDYIMSNFKEDLYASSEAFATRFQDTVLGKGFFESGKKLVTNRTGP